MLSSIGKVSEVFIRITVEQEGRLAPDNLLAAMALVLKANDEAWEQKAKFEAEGHQKGKDLVFLGDTVGAFVRLEERVHDNLRDAAVEANQRTDNLDRL